FPARLVRRACLPEDEIERVLLTWVVWIGARLRRQRDHVLATQSAQAAVVGDTAHAEIDMALSLVSVSLRLEQAHQIDDLRYGLAGPGEHVWRPHVERSHVRLIEGGLLGRQPVPAGAQLASPPEDLVVD